MDTRLEQELSSLAAGAGRLVVLTGAGISAESGIPTFRGPGGFWTVGAQEYQPEEIATYAFFAAQPAAAWQWYLYRMGACRAAEPNAGHFAVARMEQVLGDRFTLVTQNVDGLHPRAGGAPERTYEIHGNLQVHRCMNDCTQELWPCPASVYAKEKDEPLSAADEQALRCPRCGAWARPHVLWFDECYDEAHFRFNSSLEAVASADLLLIVGTTGATNLPMQMGVLAARSGAALVDVNPSPNPFATLAKRTGGFALQGKAGDLLPPIADALEA